MKSTFTTLVILLVIGSASFFLTGCEEATRLAECEQNAANLQKKLDKQGKEIVRLKHAEESMKKELDALEKENARLNKAGSQTPEQKENIRKGMEQLRKLQQESIERMRKEAAEKPATVE